MTRHLQALTLGSVLIVLIHGLIAIQPRPNHRQKRILSLFNIVQFQNSQCRVNSDLFGTCFTQNECSRKVGRPNGNCAAGFGVCCVFAQSTGDVNQNCTYVQNRDFPSGTTTNQIATFRINSMPNSEICQLRLDFLNFDIDMPNNMGRCTSDTLIASSSRTTSPTLCGNLAGQHMYLDTERGLKGVLGSIEIITQISTTARSFNIKVSYIECNNPSRAPANCLQYFEGPTARIRSYNFGGFQVQNQRYSHCFRQEPGTCSFSVQESPSLGGSNSFALFNDATPDTSVVVDCLAATPPYPSYISFPIQAVGATNMICGDIFGDIAVDTVPSSVSSVRGSTPYIVDFLSTIDDQMQSTGFDLIVVQQAC